MSQDESKDDVEKASKESQNGANGNALDQVKADETDTGKTGKVRFTHTLFMTQ